jgi:hypothetical protein
MYFLYPWGFWVSQIVIFWFEQMWTIDYQVFIEGRYLQLGFPYILILALKVTLLQPPLRLGILKFFTQMAFHIYIYIYIPTKNLWMFAQTWFDMFTSNEFAIWKVWKVHIKILWVTLSISMSHCHSNTSKGTMIYNHCARHSHHMFLCNYFIYIWIF